MNDFQVMIRRIRNSLKDALGQGNNKEKGNKRPDIKMCPNCGKFVAAKARQCEYCQVELDPKPRPEPKDSPGGGSSSFNPTMVVFGLCILFFFLSIFFSAKVEDYDLAGRFWRPSGEVLVRLGSNVALYTFYGEPWRLVTYNFLHGDMMHIFFNLMVLAQLGPLTFHNYGARRFWILVFVTGAAGGLLSGLPFISGAVPHNSVGFSGVLFGFLGANFIYLRKHGFYAAAQRFLNYMIWGNAILILITFIGLLRVDNLAHIVGMVAGLLMGNLFASRFYNFLHPAWEYLINGFFIIVWGLGLWRVFLLIDGRFG